MTTYKIYNAIFYEPTYARISITNNTFKKYGDEFLVEVYKGNDLQGKGIVNKNDWIKKAVLKEKKAMLYPDDPMLWFYGNLVYKSQDEIDKQEFLKYNV